MGHGQLHALLLFLLLLGLAGCVYDLDSVRQPCVTSADCEGKGEVCSAAGRCVPGDATAGERPTDAPCEQPGGEARPPDAPADSGLQDLALAEAAPDLPRAETGPPDGPRPEGALPDGPPPDSAGPDGPWPGDLAYDGGGAVSWVAKVTSTSSANAEAIALDKNGNAYIIGWYKGNATFGTDTLTCSASGGTLFVAKLDPDGKYLWAVQPDNVSDGVEGMDIVLDSSNNAYVTGSLRGAATFGTTILSTANSAEYDVLVAKLDQNGKFLWAARGGGPTGNDEGNAIATDSSGNSYVTGVFVNGASFGTCTLTTAAGNNYKRMFAARVSASGGFEWAAGVDGNSMCDGKGIANDGAYAYVVGSYNGSASFGSTLLTSSSSSADIFVSKLVAGTGAWVTTISAGGASADDGDAIAMDSAQSKIYITGTFLNQASFGTTTLSSTSGKTTMYVAMLDSSSMAFGWAVNPGGMASPVAIVLGGNGQLVTTGEYSAATFGPTTLTCATGAHPFVASQDPATGSFYGAKSDQGCTGAFVHANDVAVGAGGAVTTIGQLNYSTTFDGISISGGASYDGFIWHTPSVP